FLEWRIHTYLTIVLQAAREAIFRQDKIGPWKVLESLMQRSLSTHVDITKNSIVWQASGGIKGVYEKSTGKSYMLMPTGEKQNSKAFEFQLKSQIKFALAAARQVLRESADPITSMPTDFNYDDVLP